MKRDMEYVRELLLAIEEKDYPNLKGLLPPGATSADHMKLAEHLAMLIDEAGLVDGQEAHTLGTNGESWHRIRLTWQGHDFLDSVRNPETWAKTKKGALAAGGFTMDILKDLAKGLIKKQIEEHTGVKL